MAFKKLKEVVAPGVNPDGSFVRSPRYEKGHTITILVETTGQLRLLVLVPPFMGDAVRGGWKYRDIELEEVTPKKDAPKQWALVGRDPETIAQAWSDLVHHYNKLVSTTTLTPKIRIRRSRDRFSSYNASGNVAAIEIDFLRYLKNAKEPDGRYDHSVRDYEWNDEMKPLKAISRYHDSREWLEVKYDERLWHRLETLRDQIRHAQERYEAMVESGEVVQRLLSGSLLMLGSDQ